jgi:hypothetical protein
MVKKQRKKGKMISKFKQLNGYSCCNRRRPHSELERSFSLFFLFASCSVFERSQKVLTMSDSGSIIYAQAVPVDEYESNFFNDASAHSDSFCPLLGSSDTDGMDIVRLLSQLQQLNPTRSALHQQLQQLIYHIEHDRGFSLSDRETLLNPPLRETIKKLEDDYNHRGYINRPNCPVRRDLMFHYANLYMKYQEVNRSKSSLCSPSAPPLPSPAVATSSSHLSSTVTPHAVPIQISPSDSNSFNSRLRTQQLQQQIQKKKKVSDLITISVLLLLIYLIYKWFF